MDIAHIDWIPAGTRFGIDEMAFFVGHGERDVDDALADVDLVVTGPARLGRAAGRIAAVRRRSVHEAAPVRLH